MDYLWEQFSIHLKKKKMWHLKSHLKNILSNFRNILMAAFICSKEITEHITGIMFQDGTS
jgi:hypothetical protein